VQLGDKELHFEKAPPIFESLCRGPPRPVSARSADSSTHPPVITNERLHMASSSGTIQTGIQAVLVVVILGLAYFLYQSITEPYDRIERRQQITEDTRARMSNIRTALIDYERDSAAYPDSLDLLLQHMRNDSILSTRQDSVFGGPVNLDSLFFSPRTGNRFQYTVSDTGRVETYLLEDPDTDDQIGTLTGDPTRANAASWE